jgi:hypothetical protein
MTVCIAAVCGAAPKQPAKRIVLCTDLMGSNVLGKKLLVKDKFIARNWHCLTAGVDDEINALIPKLTKQLALLPHIDETNIVQAIRAALQARKIEKSDEITSLDIHDYFCETVAANASLGLEIISRPGEHVLPVADMGPAPGGRALPRKRQIQFVTEIAARIPPGWGRHRLVRKRAVNQQNRFPPVFTQTFRD